MADLLRLPEKVELDLQRYELRVAGTSVKLERIPMELLILLVGKKGDLVTREAIVEKLWGKDVFVDVGQSINSAIRKVRRALNDDPEHPRYVETVVGVGYRFVGPIHVIEKPASAPPAIEVKYNYLLEVRGKDEEPLQSPGHAGDSFQAVEETETPKIDGTHDESFEISRWLFVLAGAAVVAIPAVLFGLNVGGWRDRLLSRNQPMQIRSIAVLPLQNLSGDPNQEYFADGMTDELITDLAKIGSLRVISRTSVMRFKGTREPLPQIGRELNVDAIVEGSVMRSGDRVRITAQLVQAPTDKHLWAESYDRDLRDILELQSQVARAITGNVRVKLRPEEVAKLSSFRQINPEAYSNYLRGRYYWNQMTPDGIKNAIVYFNASIEKDPQFAFAYSGLADSFILECFFLGHPPNESLPKAKVAALKALEIDDSLAEAHISRAQVSMILDRDWPTAGREIRRALELDPNYAFGHVQAMTYWRLMGQPAKVIEEGERALELDPYSIYSNGWVSYEFCQARQYDRAMQVAQRWRRLGIQPDLLTVEVAEVEMIQGRHDQAIAELQAVAAVSDRNPFVVAQLAYAYALAGRRSESLTLLRALAKQSKQEYVSSYFLAMVYAGLNDKDRAFASLDKAYDEHSNFMVVLKDDPLLDSLRPDPRFQALLRRMGLSQ